MKLLRELGSQSSEGNSRELSFDGARLEVPPAAWPSASHPRTCMTLGETSDVPGNHKKESFLFCPFSLQTGQLSRTHSISGQSSSVLSPGKWELSRAQAG